MIIAGHTALFDDQGRLRPWTSWNVALARELDFYQQCPRDHGYPRFVLATFLDGDWTPMADRTDTIPSTQNGMGILSYLKFYELRGRQDPNLLQTARSMGDYLVKEALTPLLGRYPAFTRSTGRRDQFPCPRTAARRPIAPMKSSRTRAALPATRCCGCSRRRASPDIWSKRCKTPGSSPSINRTATPPNPRGRFGPTIAAARAAVRCRET